MKKSVQSLFVVSNNRLSPDHYLLKLKVPLKIESILPGQFVNILVDNSQNVFLRRPYSIHAVDFTNSTFDVLIKALGEGSRCLTKKQPGDQIDIIFPLGNGFTLPSAESKDENILLVGGGCGVAPLFYLAQQLNGRANLSIILGARSSIELIEIEKYDEFGKVYTTTEDGSRGEKGYVTNHSIFNNDLEKFSRIYACGPEPMMKAVAARAKEKDIFCEVSLENTMACGFGVCLCCVTDTINGHKCVCTDGPVFNIKKLRW